MVYPKEGAKAMRTQTTSTTGPSRAASESPRVVSRDEWLAERTALLAQETELPPRRARVAGEHRALPWVRLDKDYVFATPAGRRRLPSLLQGARHPLEDPLLST